MYYGYHRVSTSEQKLDRGVSVIEAFCNERGYPLEKIFVDKMTGKAFDRPRYIVLKEDVLRAGDTLILSELDRLGRDKKQIAADIAFFQSKGIRVMFLDIPTTTIDYDNIPDDITPFDDDTKIGMTIAHVRTFALRFIPPKYDYFMSIHYYIDLSNKTINHFMGPKKETLLKDYENIVNYINDDGIIVKAEFLDVYNGFVSRSNLYIGVALTESLLVYDDHVVLKTFENNNNAKLFVHYSKNELELYQPSPPQIFMW